MLRLHARIKTSWDGDNLIARVTSNYALPPLVRSREALLVRDTTREIPPGFQVYLATEASAIDLRIARLIGLPDDLLVDDGDIFVFSPRTGELRVIYRRKSRSNSLLLTERCNSKCLMCSQPPRDVDDGYLVEQYLYAIPLMSSDTEALGLTGGEPTLLGNGLIRLILACKQWLPHTSLHVLSNGRKFKYLGYCEKVAKVGHPDLMFGIPLYSDLPHLHDFVVQADGAYDETIRGLINLKRCAVKVEIRVVLHQYTIPRLVQLAHFIGRNLPFADHVTLMGLELMGYTKMNLNALWIDPWNYRDELRAAVLHLAEQRMNVSVYNHQLCVLHRDVWPYARKSISDWKNDYLGVCSSCAVKPECGGFFTSGLSHPSQYIHPIEETSCTCSSTL